MKKQYLPPTLTVVTFKAERGFAGSVQFLHMIFSPEDNPGYNSSGQESWSQDDGSFGSGW